METSFPQITPTSEEDRNSHASTNSSFGVTSGTGDFQGAAGDFFSTRASTDSTAHVTGTITFPAAVPEASTTVSFGLLPALGLGGVAVASRKRKAVATA